MQGTAAIVVGALLVALLLIIGAVMLLQEARHRTEARPPEYIIEDAVQFVLSRLDPGVRGRLGRAGVRRILEWQVFFLQQLAKQDKNVPIVVGTTEGTIDYISARMEKQGHDVARPDISAVLEAQGGYLASIGAVGGPTDEVF